MALSLLELLVVALIIGLQLRAFTRSRHDSSRLAALFPETGRLFLAPVYDAVADYQVKEVAVAEFAAGPEFTELLADTNSYLRKNKGTADFNLLQSIAERRAGALDDEVQGGTSAPLYIGLMGTFGGAILGLGSLLLSGGKFDDLAIQAFLQGVAIAMVGSLCGLGLSQWAGALYRDARRQAEGRRNGYYTFLQVELLPILHSDMAGSLGNLKSVLDAFNKEFLSKIYEFGPIVGALNENISTQKDFLEELRKVGYTEMADASIRVFDKVAQSAHHFENFIAYQEKLNAMLLNGGAVAERIQSLLGRLTGLEEGLNQVPELVKQHDGTVRAQLAFFQQNQAEMDRLAGQTGQFFDEQYHQLAETMRRRMAYFQQEANEASNLWQEHFQALNRDNIYERIVKYMEPLGNLPQQQAQLNKQHEILAQSIGRTNEQLMRKLTDDAQLHQQLTAQMKTLNALLEKATAKGPVGRMVEKVFGGPAPTPPAQP
jgi:hypothetical protein